ncbi:MAG: GxxExxY protein [Filimonas sp.]|nr:GxxExxY protein [Filimonas sp.]
MITKNYLDNLTYNVIGCAIEVHRHLGPGLLESVYEKCLIKELTLRGLSVSSQLKVPIHYKGLYIDADLRLDLLVEDLLVVEIKAVEKINPVYEAQLLSYLQLLNKPKGLLLNFCCSNIFKEGQRTFVTDLFTSLPS